MLSHHKLNVKTPKETEAYIRGITMDFFRPTRTKLVSI